ncbi:phage tail tape measure protein [Macrococcus capreoli]|uniref:phage tail tape measure protein n=1 Tax=Macrococcus capreoli TaxID=2982690 RepID=UPI003EE56B45
MSAIGEPIGKSVVEVGLDDSKLVSGLTNLNAKMKLADNTWKESLATFKQSDRSIEKLSVSVKGMTEKLKAQSQIVEAHKQKVAKLTSEYGETHTKVIKANAELKKQEAIFGNLKRSISEVTSEIEQLKKAEQINNSPWGRRSRELQQYSDKLSVIGDKMTSIGQNMSMKVTAPIAVGFGAAVKSSMDFESQMDRVGAISDTTGSKFNDMTKLAMELGAKTTKSASEVAKGMEEMAAKGFNANQIMKAMPGIISAAEASGSDMAQTAEVMASAMNAFGLEAGKSGHVADVLAQTANQSAADITDMQYALKYAAAPAHSLGMSLEETSASIGMMVDAGLKGEQAGTTLRGALLGLLDPSEENSKRMEKMGIAITDNEGNFVGMSKLIGNLQHAMLGMTDTQKAATLSQLVGKEAVSGMLVMMQKSPAQIDKMTQALEQSDGASKKAADAMMDNLKGAVEEMKGAFETLGIQVGQDLTPMIRGLADGLQSAATHFSEMPGWARKTAIGIGLVAAATGPVVLGLGFVAKSASTAADGLSKLTGYYAKNTIAAEVNAAANLTAGASIEKQGGKLGKVTGIFTKFGKGASGAAGSVGMLGRVGSIASRAIGLFASGPVGIAIAAVAALGLTFKLAYDHIGWFHDGVENTKKLFNEVASSIDFRWVGEIGKGFKDAGKWIGDATGKIARLGFETSPIGIISKATFGIVNESIKKATDTVNIYGNGVSKSTKQALKGYTDLSQKARLQLEILRSSHKTIGDKQYQEVVSLYDKMANTAVSKIESRRKREIYGLQKLFADTKGLKASEENRILTEANSGANKEVKAVQSIQKQIKDIYSKAHKEKRALTDIEESKIVVLQQKMDQKVVQSLSQSEKEQRIILGRLKDNKKALSIQAAAEVIKASANERDESIKNARKKRDKIIDEAIYQRDVTKNISKEQADKIIKDAERQYSESKKNAEQQHKSVVSEAKRQNKNVSSEIDSQTGHVLSQWEKTKRNVNIIATAISTIVVDKFHEMRDGATKWVTSIGKFISDSTADLKSRATKLGQSIADGAVGGLNLMVDGVNWIADKLGMDKPLNHFNVSKRSTGTGATKDDELAIVGDRGPGNGPAGFRQELIRYPDGSIELTPSHDTLRFLPKGTTVFNGEQTHRMLPFLNGEVSHERETGAGGFNLLDSAGDAFNTIRSTTASMYNTSVEKVKGATNAVKDFAGDIMEYASNPGKLVSLAMDKFGVNFNTIKGVPGSIMQGAFSKLKTGITNKVMKWFDESGGDGKAVAGILDPNLISYFFGYTPEYTAATGRPYHEGVDFPFNYQPVKTPMGGILTRQPFMNNGYGNWVTVDSGNTRLIFGHLANYGLSPASGSRVKPGDVVGKTGDTGFSTGPHLHFGVKVGGRDINPLPWLRNAKVTKRSNGTFKPSYKTHKVKSGDTLWDISRRNGTTVKALQLLNGIKNHLIYPGQIIKLTGAITNLSNNVSKQTKAHSISKVPASYISRAQSLYNAGKSILNRGKSSNKVTGKDDINLGTLIMNNTKNLGSLSLEAAQKNIDAIVSKINSMITSSTSKIATLNNKISKSTNKKTIANARNDIQAYKAQIASLQKLKQNEVLKTNYLRNLIKEKARLTTKINQRNEEGKALQEEKINYRSSISSNLQNFAGFGASKGHTSKDFVSFMKYRLSKMKEYASNVRKLKDMGLDPILLRELLSGGIENAMHRVAALVRGGKGYIGQINSLQRSINAEINSIANEQSNYAYDTDIKANKQQITTLQNQQSNIDRKKVVYLNDHKRITKSSVKANPKKPISNTSRTVTTMRTHNIKWGDTLGLIAQRYGTTVSELKKANNLKSDMIYAGRTLKVPTKKVVQLPKTQKALDQSTRYIIDTAKRYQLVNNSSKLNNLQKQLNKIKSDKDKKNDVVIAKLEKTLRDLTKKYDKQDEVVKLLQQLVNKNPDILLNGVKLTKEMDKMLANNSKINARRKAR